MGNPRRLAALAVLCGTVALAGWIAVGLAGLGSPGIESIGASAQGRSGRTTGTEHADAPQVTAPGEDGVSVADIGSDSAALADPRPIPRPTTPLAPNASVSTPDPVRNEGKETACSVEVADTASTAALPDRYPMSRPAALAVLLVAMGPTDPVQNAARQAIGSGTPDACLNSDVCIDQYLWSLYERTPKFDTVKMEERIKMKVKNKGKTRTVVKTLIKYVTEDFAWKDPKAAQKAGMSLKDYVIGGMDRELQTEAV